MSEGTEVKVQSESNSSSDPAPAVFLGLSLGQAIVMLAWPILLISAMYAFLIYKNVAVLEAALRARPAVKVVDVTSVMRANIGKGMTADQAIIEANKSFQALGKAGYVVIDSNSILAAPASAEFK